MLRFYLLCKFLLKQLAVLLEKGLPTAGNSHILLGQNLEESFFTEGFALGCRKRISSSVASDTTVGPSLTAKWRKVNYCDCSPRNYLA